MEEIEACIAAPNTVEAEIEARELAHIIESDVTNFQGTNDAGNYLDGIPKENFQANHPIVGAEVYQYGDNIVVKIEGKYWLYENYHNTDLDGNPDGYDPLHNNQTSGEEVSEQDPAAN